MPIYIYTALSENGALIAGEEAAATTQELSQQLSGKGLLVQSIRKKSGRFSAFKRRAIKPEVFLLFNQEFIALIRAGLTIPEALKLAGERPDHPALAVVLQRVLEDVRGGKLFSEACTQHPEVFDGLYIAALKTGEKTGALVSVLTKYQASLKTRIEFEKKVSHALAYPLFLLATLVIIVGVLFAFVMPRFVAMYTDFGAQLPVATRILIAVVDGLPLYLTAATIVGALSWLGWRRWTATDRGRLWVDGMKGRLPVLGDINRHIASARLTRSLATLLSGGTPLVEAMQTTQASLRNRADARRLAQATVMVTEGKSLTEALRTSGMLSNTALKMIEVGEASGGLDGMLAEIAQYYEEILANKLARATVLIEPLLMLLMGVFIGGIIIVMYLPIFYMVDIVK